jgi:hypothetical protein
LKHNQNLFFLEEMQLPPEYSPTVIEVTTIVTTIRKESPNLGLQKVLLAIRQNEPTWALSEKVLAPYVVLTIALKKDSRRIQSTNNSIRFISHLQTNPKSNRPIQSPNQNIIEWERVIRFSTNWSEGRLVH